MEVLPRDDWFTVVDMEEGEALVAAIINEILLKSHDVLFEKHIEVQVLPYAVQFAKETLLSIIQWEFFKRDEGVIDSETWHPDEEPRPVMIDSWGRGVLPIVDRRPTKKVARKRVPSNAETQITYMSQRAEEKPKQVAPSPSPEPDVRVPAAAEPGTETIVRKGKVSLKNTARKGKPNDRTRAVDGGIGNHGSSGDTNSAKVGSTSQPEQKVADSVPIMVSKASAARRTKSEITSLSANSGTVGRMRNFTQNSTFLENITAIRPDEDGTPPPPTLPLINQPSPRRNIIRKKSTSQVPPLLPIKGASPQ